MMDNHATSIFATLIRLLCLFCCTPAHAQPNTEPHNLLPKNHDETIAQPFVPLEEDKSIFFDSHNSSPNQSIDITAQSLAKNPELLGGILIQALASNNAQAVKALLPHYQNPEAFVASWANALLLTHQGNHQEAIAIYHQLHLAQPNHEPIALQYAIALLHNHQTKSAYRILDNLQAHSQNSELNALIDELKTSAHRRERQTWAIGGSWIQDKNINNAPKAGTQFGYFTATPPQSATGVHYHLHTKKDHLIADNWYVFGTGEVSGKQFFDSKNYNENSIGLTGGLSHRTHDRTYKIAPFVKKNWYAGSDTGTLHTFSDETGLTLSLSHWHSPKVRTQSELSLAKESYEKYTHLNGNTRTGSLSLLYTPTDTQTLTLGMGIHQKSAQEKGNAYTLNTLRLGWHKDWQAGINSHLHIVYGKRHYDDKRPFFGIQQKNHEHTITLGIDHDKWQWRGFYPRLVLSHQKSKSNINFYDYDKKRAFIEIHRKF